MINTVGGTRSQVDPTHGSGEQLGDVHHLGCAALGRVLIGFDPLIPDDHGYILPGLGDAGDRIFGTQ